MSIARRLGFAALCASVSTSAMAQAADQGDEIIVASTRIETPYPKAPAAFEAVKLEPTTLLPAQILNRVPGVNIQQGSGAESLTAIRAPVLTGGAGAGSYLYAVDGISLRAPGFSNVNGFLDMPTEFASRIEVGKGPMPITGGTNAVHGLINVVSDDYPETRIKTLIGSDEYASLTGTYGQDIGHGFFALGGHITHDGGFRAESGYDTQKLYARAFQSIGEWDIDAALFATNLNQETAGFAQGPDAFRDEDIAFGNANPEAFRDVKSLLGYISARRSFDNFDLTVKPYARSTDMQFRLHFLPGKALERNDHTSAGVIAELGGQTEHMRWAAGVDVNRTDGHLDEFQEAPRVFSFIQGDHYDYDVIDQRFAIFADTDIDITDRLSVNTGARYERVNFDYTNNIESGLFGRFLRLDDQSDSFDVFMPRIALRYEIAPTVQSYVRLARGARAPQTTDLYRVQINQRDNPADIETLDSAEIGLKGRVENVIFDLSAYTMRKENYFFRDADGFNISDGETAHRGVEGAASIDVSDSLSIEANLTLARHTYAFDRIVARGSEVIRSGNRMDTAPDVTGGAAVTWRPVDAASLTLRWVHMGEYFTDAANENLYPGHDILGLSGAYDRDKISLFGRIENLTDARYADRADFAFGNERYFPGRPRSVFMGLSKAF